MFKKAVKKLIILEKLFTKDNYSDIIKLTNSEGSDDTMAILFLMFGIIFVFIDLTVTIIIAVLGFLYALFIGLYTYFKVTVPMEKSGFLDKVRNERALEEKKKRDSTEYKILQAKNNIKSASLALQTSLKAKYPKADQYLFEQLCDNFSELSTSEISTIKELIRKSHNSKL